MIQELVGLPDECDLRLLGIDPAGVTAIAELKRSVGHALYRLVCGRRAFVLKWFTDPGQTVEVRAYRLLTESGVPTVPVYGAAANALLLEDLAASAEGGELVLEVPAEKIAVGIFNLSTAVQDVAYLAYSARAMHSHPQVDNAVQHS